jgi:hypothetical protein
MRLHEFATKRPRLKLLKKVFDRIYGELARCQKRAKKSDKKDTNRKPLPPAPREERTGRSPLSARYPTLSSTAQHMPQRLAGLRRRKVVKPSTKPVATAKPRRRPVPRVTPPAPAAKASKPMTKPSTERPPVTGSDAAPANQQSKGLNKPVVGVPPSANTVKPVPAQPVPARAQAQHRTVPQRPATWAQPPQTAATTATQKLTPNALAWRAANQPQRSRKPNSTNILAPVPYR